MKSSLRPWSMDDLSSLVKYGDNPKIFRNMSDGFPFPYTDAKARHYIERVSQDLPLQAFAIDLNGEAIGSIGIHLQADIHRRNAELGYWIGEPFWGNGIITHAIRDIVEYSFLNFEIDRIFARPFSSNLASHRALEKAGFILEARFNGTLIKNGEVLDELIFAIRR